MLVSFVIWPHNSITDVLMVVGGLESSSVELIDLSFGANPLPNNCPMPGRRLDPIHLSKLLYSR